MKTIGALPGFFFGNPSTSSKPCTPCPDNCKTVQEHDIYFAHREKLNETDIPVIVYRKRIVCTPVENPPVLTCQLELQKLQQQLLSR